MNASKELASESFLDVYHLPIVHPQLAEGFAGARLYEEVEISDDILGLAMPEGLGISGEGEWPLPRFSGLGDERLRIEVFAILPNTLMLVEPDNQQVIVLRPQSPALTLETFANYVVSDASLAPELAEEREELYRTAVEVNDQDLALLARLQQSRSMDVGGRTRPSPSWDETVRRFQCAWATRLLGGGRAAW